MEEELWTFLERHLKSIYDGDWTTYEATTSSDLAIYEWFVTPHRLDGLPFHRFMIERSWATRGKPYRIDLLDKRLQVYGNTAIFSYTLLLTVVEEGELKHRTINETRVAIRFPEGWKIVHVHKSPGEKIS
ncbi:MAG: nuclear transport factor 2 family protein [Synergistetes bacterium]|nr:nuclear transport factor 2 family protein [Synergistota bacterium]MCX8127220.1 nuclear transport factor 2 family protein [Synergistota bacterium]MDW8191894.1 nuclear transport factor 2 family protein [Synergistota bacterium]